MKQMKAFGAFWYDFVIGDDWRIALAVAVALATTFFLARATAIPVWWLLPAVVVICLPLSLRRATRSTG